MGLSRLNLYRSGAAALEVEVNCLAVMAKIRQNAKYTLSLHDALPINRKSVV